MLVQRRLRCVYVAYNYSVAVGLLLCFVLGGCVTLRVCVSGVGCVACVVLRMRYFACVRLFRFVACVVLRLCYAACISGGCVTLRVCGSQSLRRR